MQYGLFPARVQAGATQHQRVRVYCTDEVTELWRMENGQPTVIATGPGLVKQKRAMGERFEDGTRAKWVLLLEDGQEWLVTPGGGCGCSDKMKAFNPAKAVRT